MRYTMIVLVLLSACGTSTPVATSPPPGSVGQPADGGDSDTPPSGGSL